MTAPEFISRKQQKKTISMITCYDSWSAAIIAETEIDCILVGDSASMVMHGYESTIQATIEMMAAHTAAVRRGAPSAFIIGDMPFLSNRVSLDIVLDNVRQLMQAGANSIKLEGAKGNLEIITHIVDSGVPVMGHLGLTPQSVNQFGGYRVQGKKDQSRTAILNEALQLEKAGCFAIVIECVPADLGKEIAESLTIPIIGIGAGNGVDGQVLVLQDMLGMGTGKDPKFVRRYLEGANLISEALNRYHHDVTDKTFPSNEESYR
jgi:3-methyl-2-oxobutanoate hydroxymethyltransferase